jgi:hypothetical protein
MANGQLMVMTPVTANHATGHSYLTLRERLRQGSLKISTLIWDVRSASSLRRLGRRCFLHGLAQTQKLRILYMQRLPARRLDHVFRPR